MSSNAERLTDDMDGVEWVEPSRLVPFEANPRQITDAERENLKRLLRTYGFRLPIVARREDGLIVGGHQRLHIAVRDLGYDTVPVAWVDGLTDEDAAALNIALNNPEAQGSWDMKRLATIVAELDAHGYDATLTGFTDAKLEDIIAWTREPEEEEGEPPTPDLPEDPDSEPGRVYELGRHRLLCGDAEDPDMAEALLDGATPDMILTDPPYGIGLDTDWSDARGHLGGRSTRGTRYDPIKGDDLPYDPRPMLELYGGGREAFLFGAEWYADAVPGLRQGSWLVWDKRLEGQEDGFGSEFELIWSLRRHKRRLLRHQWFGFLADDPEEARDRVHPTQKPVALIHDILAQWSRAHDLVADPYAGSGSILIACHDALVTCYAAEVDPRYCDVIRTRYAEHTGDPGCAP